MSTFVLNMSGIKIIKEEFEEQEILKIKMILWKKYISTRRITKIT